MYKKKILIRTIIDIYIITPESTENKSCRAPYVEYQLQVQMCSSSGWEKLPSFHKALQTSPVAPSRGSLNIHLESLLKPPVPTVPNTTLHRLVVAREVMMNVDTFNRFTEHVFPACMNPPTKCLHLTKTLQTLHLLYI